MLGDGRGMRWCHFMPRVAALLAGAVLCLIAVSERGFAMGPLDPGDAAQVTERYVTPVGGGMSLSNARDVAAGQLRADSEVSDSAPNRGASPALGRTVAPDGAADTIPEAGQARAMATAAAEAAVEAGIANDAATAALAAARAENAAEAAAWAAGAAQERARLVGTSEAQAAARAAAEAAARARLNALTAAEAVARLRQAPQPAHPDSLWLD